MQPCIWVMLCFSVRTIAQTGSDSREGSSPVSRRPEASPRRTLCSIRNNSTFKASHQHTPKKQSSKSYPEACLSYLGSVLAGSRESEGERVLSNSRDWSLPGFSLHSPCAWAHQLPFTNTMFFVPCRRELMQLLCIFLAFFLCRSFLHSPPSLLLLFLFCSDALALYQSFLLSVSVDVRHGSVWVCLPSPSSLLSSLLSPFTRRRDVFSASHSFLFLCLLYFPAAKMRACGSTKINYNMCFCLIQPNHKLA